MTEERNIRYDEIVAGITVDVDGYRAHVWLTCDEDVEWFGELRQTAYEAAEDAAIALVAVFDAESDALMDFGVNVRKVGQA